MNSFESLIAQDVVNEIHHQIFYDDEVENTVDILEGNEYIEENVIKEEEDNG